MEKSPSGNAKCNLPFSLHIGLAFLVFIFFLGLAQNIMLQGSFVKVDMEIMNLVSNLRNIQIAKFFLFFTYLGNTQIIVSLVIIVLVILGLSGKWRIAKLSLVSVISGEVLYYFIKLLIQRDRPDVSFSLISSGGYSFPSGHATCSIIFYGILGFLLWRLFRKRWQKILITLLVVVIVFMIGFSRIYLGVHWTSDVLAGWSLGLIVLLLFIAIYKKHEEAYSEEKNRILPQKQIVAIAIGLLILESLFFCYFYVKHPLQIPGPQSIKTTYIF
jgi:undecaprenyl-diphosphatase